MKQHLWWIIALGGTLALLFILVSFGANSNTPTIPQNGNHGDPIPASGTLYEDVTEEDHAKGSADAAVTLVEYSDFQCPACRAFHPVIEQLVEEFPEDVRFVYRHFPLRSIHPNAQLAGQATEAAALQGQFFEMHDALFNTQSQWSSLPDPADFFVELAGSLELNQEQFRTDMESSDARNAVNDDLRNGNRSNVQGTPSLFINGNKISNPRSYEELKGLVEAAMAQ